MSLQQVDKTLSLKDIRRKTYDFLEMGSFAGPVAGLFEWFMVFLILSNIVVVALESVPHIWEAHEQTFWYFEVFSVTVFSADYLVRLWSCVEREALVADQNWKSRVKYIFTPMAIVDLAAILPFFLWTLFTADLRFLRVFRLLRLLKLVRYSPGVLSLVRVVYAERRALVAALIIMVGLLFFSASLMHYIEGEAQPNEFGSIPSSLWFSLATLTTIGYGDVVPVTTAGKIVGGLFMIFGLAFYAIPIGIIASGFSNEVHRKEFVVSRSVILATGLFHKLPPTQMHELGVRMRTMESSVGTVLAHRQDEANGLFILISGQATAYFHQRSIPLQPGDFFGEVGFLSDAGRQATVVSRTKCKVLWLESPDLHLFLSMNADIGEQLMESARVRILEMVDGGHLSSDESQELLTVLDAKLSR
ncbi:cyclic nucleotide-binding protein [Kordiimonas sediminis]|uniref:Cyclic nucleotide-binding protein n=1 Tax=Kordiimonas sediminis TaxID=1735581 RepID=A0A919AV53_9PROT|nr:cyclic nucleotide-gated ion channel [Kordiimonas sediminis]GHF27127.1 cyclic nucleotide-binding protein [Kordiimonas sediminis]